MTAENRADIVAVRSDTGQEIRWFKKAADETAAEQEAGAGQGVFIGDTELVAEANQLCDTRTEVALSPTGPWLEANRNDPVAVVGVLMAVCKGQVDLSGAGMPQTELDELLDVPDGGVA